MYLGGIKGIESQWVRPIEASGLKVVEIWKTEEVGQMDCVIEAVIK